MFYEYTIYMLRHEDWSIDYLDILCLFESMDFYGIMMECYMIINVSSSMLCLGRFLPIAIGFTKSHSLNIIPFLTFMIKWIYVCGSCMYSMFCRYLPHVFKVNTSTISQSQQDYWMTATRKLLCDFCYGGTRI